MESLISSTHLHAMLIHFPIALLLIGFLSEITGLVTRKPFFSNAGLFLLLLGTAGAIAAYFSGEAAGEGMEEGSFGQAVALHEQAALFAMISSVAAALVRLVSEFLKQRYVWLKVASVLVFALAIAAITRTGYLGGQLVYKHAAGVELALTGLPGS